MSAANTIALIAEILFICGTLWRGTIAPRSIGTFVAVIMGCTGLLVVWVVIAYSLYYLTLIAIPLASTICLFVFGRLFNRFATPFRRSPLRDLRLSLALGLAITVATALVDICLAFVSPLHVDMLRWPLIALPIWSLMMPLTIQKKSPPSLYSRQIASESLTLLV